MMKKLPRAWLLKTAAILKWYSTKETKTSRFKLFIPSAGRSIAIEHCKYFSPRTDLGNNVQYFLFYSFTL